MQKIFINCFYHNSDKRNFFNKISNGTFEWNIKNFPRELNFLICINKNKQIKISDSE